MHSLFTQLMDFPTSTLSKRNESFNPAVNIQEAEESFQLQLAVPGFLKENLEIRLEEDRLHIDGKSEEVKEENSPKKLRTEFHSSSFHREFQLPKNLDLTKIEAKTENGVLQIVLPKKSMEALENKQKIAIS